METQESRGVYQPSDQLTLKAGCADANLRWRRVPCISTAGWVPEKGQRASPELAVVNVENNGAYFFRHHRLNLKILNSHLDSETLNYLGVLKKSKINHYKVGDKFLHIEFIFGIEDL